MRDEDYAWQVEYGEGGWIRVTSTAFDGWLYLKLALEPDGRVTARELYYDAREGETTAKFLRDLPLSNIVAFAADGFERSLIDLSTKRPGPNLSLLASHFASTWGVESTRRSGRPNPDHWVALAWRSQFVGSEVEQPAPGRAPKPLEVGERPPQLESPPDGRLTDDFLRSVADNYAWALTQRLRPAPTLAKMANVSPRTVHGWVAKARDRGIMPRTRQGRSS